MELKVKNDELHRLFEEFEKLSFSDQLREYTALATSQNIYRKSSLRLNEIFMRINSEQTKILDYYA